jgi:lantibiotic modifying enzyme
MENQKLNHSILLNQVDEIAIRLLDLKNKISTFGLNSGKSGIALFYCYYAAFKNDETYLAVADNILSECFENINPKTYAGHNYFRELAEFGIFLTFAHENQWIQAEIEPFLANVDTHLYGYMQKKIIKNNLDVYDGALSSGEYFLNRESTSELITKALNELVYAINNTKNGDEFGGYFWKSPIFNDDRVYTGLSHGVAMIINFLCKTIERNIEPELSKELIKGASLFLRQNKGNEPAKALFPNIIGEEKGSIQLCFCYGDLGTLYTLLRAAKLLNNVDLYDETMSELYRLGQLNGLKIGNISDAEIIYGAAGVATIFDKISRTENNKVLDAYANFWYQKIPEFAIHQNETLGYQAIFNQQNSATNIGFGEGIAGIGIALMRYLNKKMPPIDELIGL